MGMSKAQRHRLATVRALAPMAPPPLRRPDGLPEEVNDMSATGLEDAALVLDALAAGEVPDRALVICGALALDTLVQWTLPGRDLLDAAAGLNIIATGGNLDLDAVGRLRARELAGAVRERAGRRERDGLPVTSRASHFS
jgi:hypothetical protein